MVNNQQLFLSCQTILSLVREGRLFDLYDVDNTVFNQIEQEVYYMISMLEVGNGQ